MYRFVRDFLIVSLITTLFFGCGSESSNKKANNTIHDPKLNIDNYKQVVQYQYKKANMNLGRISSNQSKKLRSRQPGKKSNYKIQKDVFYVNTISPFDKYVQKLMIRYNDQKIDLFYDKDTDSVTIEYFNGKNSIKDILSFKEFLELDKKALSGENK